MAVKCPDPEWYAYISDFNRKEITKFNVFNSYNFMDGCRRTFRKYTDPKVIEKEIKSWARYSFWSKCEYEVIITELFNRQDFKASKIDVYDQLLLNWDSFFRYVMDHQAFFRRRQK